MPTTNRYSCADDITGSDEFTKFFEKLAQFQQSLWRFAAPHLSAPAKNGSPLLKQLDGVLWVCGKELTEPKQRFLNGGLGPDTRRNPNEMITVRALPIDELEWVAKRSFCCQLTEDPSGGSTVPDRNFKELLMRFAGLL
jgi:hypothetical protein